MTTLSVEEQARLLDDYPSSTVAQEWEMLRHWAVERAHLQTLRRILEVERRRVQLLELRISQLERTEEAT